MNEWLNDASKLIKAIRPAWIPEPCLAPIEGGRIGGSRAERDKRRAGAMEAGITRSGVESGRCKGGPIRRPMRSRRSSRGVYSTARSPPETVCRPSAASPNRSPPRAARCARALRSLSARGLVSRRVGSGTFVIYEPDAVDTDVFRDHLAAGAGRGPRRHRAADGPARGAQRHRARHGGAGAGRCRHGGGGGTPSASRSPTRCSISGWRRPPTNPLIVEIYLRINHVRTHQQWDIDQEQDPDAAPDRRLQPRAPGAAGRALAPRCRTRRRGGHGPHGARPRRPAGQRRLTRISHQGHGPRAAIPRRRAISW